jgi:hypothetical protein
MDVSSQEAQESLRLVEDTQTKWRKAVGASYVSGLLVLWGAIWVIGCANLQFSLETGGYVFMVLDLLGVGGTVLIARGWPVKGPESRAAFRSVMGLWAFLALYAVIWIALFRPVGGKELGAFLSTLCMFGYVVIGLWFKSSLLIGLALAATALVLVGYYLLSSYFYLWAALTGGGAMLGTGLYIRRWR